MTPDFRTHFRPIHPDIQISTPSSTTKKSDVDTPLPMGDLDQEILELQRTIQQEHANLYQMMIQMMNAQAVSPTSEGSSK